MQWHSCCIVFPAELGYTTGSTVISGPILAAIIVPLAVIVIIMAAVLTVYVVKHRRLQSSFLSFANSHYDTRSGRTRFSTSDDLGQYNTATKI